MAFEIVFDKAAAKYIKSLDVPTRGRIKEKLEELIADPCNPTHSKSLTNRSERSARIGDYRMLFEVDEKANRIFVVRFAPRGQVYR